MDLEKSVQVSASGLRAQSLRMRVIAENLANADSVSAGPSEPSPIAAASPASARDEPGERCHQVSVTTIKGDRSVFPRAYQPGNPAADAKGYVLMPNVNALTETADMKAAQRGYEANLNAIEAARALTMRTIDLLK